jgi:tetratricopeptide (TPR) repeat protein
VLGTQNPNLALIRANLALKTTKTGQLLESIKTRLSADRFPSRNWVGMEMFINQQVRNTDVRLGTVYHHFQKNLDDILDLGQRSGAKMLLCTVASNLKDSAPFGSLHAEHISTNDLLQWQRIFDEGVKLEGEGKPQEALVDYQQADQIDPNYAETAFREARCLGALDRWKEARDRYESACDLDTLRFRADGRINEIIRQEATNRMDRPITLVDIERVFAEHSPHAVPGETLFHEHVHFNFDGSYLLARTVADQVALLLAYASQPGTTRSWLTSEECAHRLALTGWNQYWLTVTMQQRLQRPPFSRQLDAERRDQRLRDQLATLKPALQPWALEGWVSAYREALSHAGDDWMLHNKFGLLLESFGQTAQAEKEWRRALELAPENAVLYYQLGRLLNRGDNRTEAVEFLAKAIRIIPHFAEAHNSMGVALSHQGKFEEAYQEFARALQGNSNYGEAQLNWGLTLAYQKKTNDALAHFSEAVRLQPDYVEARQRYAQELMRQGKLDEAGTQFEATLRLKPSLVSVHLDLGVVRARQSKFTEAIASFREALKLEPSNTTAKDLLERALKSEKATHPAS